MKEYSLTNNLFEKITFKQLFVFFQILNETAIWDQELIERKYKNSAHNFDHTIQFLKKIDVIKLKEKIRFKKTANLNLLLSSTKDYDNEGLKNEIVKLLVYNNNSFTTYIHKLLSEFQFENGRFVCFLDSQKRLHFSGLRNFLLELNFLTFNASTKCYSISDCNFIGILEYYKSKKLSPTRLKEVEHEKQVIGDNAEIQVIEYEKKRLISFPELSEKIEHVAKDDVCAGYDIRSFESRYNEKGQPIPRYIEVKAVSAFDYKFYLSRNELAVAKLLKNTYFLYLLPVESKNKYLFDSLKIINNPYANLIEKNSHWNRTVELLSFHI